MKKRIKNRVVFRKRGFGYRKTLFRFLERGILGLKSFLKREKKFLTLKQASRDLGYSKSYLRYLCERGKLKAVKMGRKWVTRKEWIEEYRTLNQKPKTKDQKQKLKIKKEGELILPLYFGWALRIRLALIKGYYSYIRKIFVIRRWWQEAVALVLLVAIIASSFFWYQSKPALGATYYWTQTDWSGGATTTAAVHPTNKTNWSYYSEAADIDFSVSGEISLPTSTGSITQTSGTDFNAGTKTDVKVSGAGEAADLILSPPATTTDFFNDTSKIATSTSIEFHTYDGQVKLSRTCPDGDYYSTDGDTLSGEKYYCHFEIQSGHTVYLASGEIVKIHAKEIYVYGTIDGVGEGYAGGAAGDCSTYDGGDGTSYNGTPGTGGGSGGGADSSGGGGGYGGAGGAGAGDNAGAGGGSFGSATDDSLYLGSGGGGGGANGNACIQINNPLSASGGNGGGAILLDADTVTIDASGTVNVAGADGGDVANSGAAGGGGSGGTIVIKTEQADITGTLNAKGGNGGDDGTSGYGGGGGGGGRIKIFYETGTVSPTYDVSRGAGGSGSSGSGASGSAGSYNIATQSYTSSLTSYATSGTFTSTNLLEGQSVGPIDSFSYNLSSLPYLPNSPGYTTAKVSFSQDGTNWYDSAGTPDGWNTMYEGVHTIDLSSLGWTEASFYYKIEFTSQDGNDTPVLDEVSVHTNYPSTGNLISSIIDTGIDNPVFTTITWNETLATGTDIDFKVRSSDNADMSGAPDWADISPIESSGGDISGIGQGRYVQYQAILSTNDPTVTPQLHDVTINWGVSGSLTSSPYDTGDASNVLAGIKWIEDLPSDSTTIKFQVRTSPDNSTWTDWWGPTATGTDYFTNSATGCSTSSVAEGTQVDCSVSSTIAIGDGSSDQWIQYKVYLETTDASQTPTLKEVSLVYVVNAPPEFNPDYPSAGDGGVGVNVASSTEVQISYSVRDPDTDAGSPENQWKLWPSFEYSVDGGNTWHSISTSTLTGPRDDIPVQLTSTSTFVATTTYWNAKSQIPGVYSTQFKVRVTIDDREAANNTASQVSATTTLDTSDPSLTSTTLLINNSSESVETNTSTVTLKLQNITGDTASETIFAQFSRDGSTWYGANSDGSLASAGDWSTGFALDTLADLAWTWTLQNRSETITVRIKDGYGNMSTTTDTNSAVWNITPEFQSAPLAFQVATSTDPDWGKVKIQYSIRDRDTLLGSSTPGYVTSSFEYSLDGGSNWSSIECTSMATGDCNKKQVDDTDFTSYTAAWDAKNQIGEHYTSNAKIRITVDDGETVNNTSSASTSVFELDTKNPTNPDVKVDASTQYGSNNANLTLSVSDDNISAGVRGYMRISLNSDFSGANWQTYSTSSTIMLETQPDTVYVKFKDAYGNVSDKAQVTTPDTPSGVYAQDVSNVDEGVYKLFIGWKVVSEPLQGSFDRYNILRATTTNDADFVKVKQITDKSTNYWIDTDVNYGVNYYYKITSEDTLGNVSFRSQSASGNPGSGGNDTLPPSFTSGPSVSQIYTTQATISWTTDELAKAIIHYGTATGTYPYSKDIDTYATSSTAVLTGLNPGTTYYAQVEAIDTSSNSATSSEISFSTLSGAQISNVSVSQVYNQKATIFWLTDVSSTSYVYYSTSTNGSFLSTGSSESVTQHQITITGLSQGTRYYFYVKSGNAVDNNAGDYYTFITTQDTKPPNISNLSAWTTAYTAVVVWQTDELADSKIEYGTSSGSYTFSTSSSSYTIDHAIRLTGLTEKQTYYYKVTSIDVNGNSSQSVERNFMPIREEDTTPPIISNVATSSVYTTQATISWTTDELANSQVDYSTDSSFLNYSTITNSSMVTSHSVVLTGLLPNTTYYFRVKSQDIADNQATKQDSFSFTTLSGPIISNVVVSSVFNDQATIVWQTDIPANSSVVYSSNPDFSTYFTSSATSSVSSHQITLSNLSVGTIYYFYVQSGNARDDNGGDYYYFSTANDTNPPQISSISSFAKQNSALILWTTDELSTSKVIYGTTTSYGNETSLDQTLTKKHAVSLSSLNASTTYHFKVVSCDANSNCATSTDQTLVTEASPDTTPPSISDISVSSVNLNSAIITWTTNESSNSLIDYGTATSSLDYLAGNIDDSTTSHSVALSGLSASTTYYFQVRSQDSSGNTATDNNSGNYYSFTTQKDTTPPTISNVSSPVVDRNSATITWNTDESATSKVEYATSSDLSNSTTTTEITDPRTEHSVVISNLLSETTYYYRAISEDTSGNTATSSIYSFTTQNAKEDSTPPVISNVATSSVSLTSVIITWTTNENSNSIVDYGTTISLGEIAGNFEESVTSHSVTLTGLTASTTYYFQVRSQDSAGNTATDDNSGSYYTFTTAQDTTSPNISSGPTASVVSDTKATIVWQTNELSTSQVFYGTSQSYGSQTTEDTTLTFQHSVAITGLTKQTTYHFKVVSKDAAGNSTSSADYTFTTTDQPGIVKTITKGGGGILIVEKIPKGYKKEKDWCDEMNLYWYDNKCHKEPKEKEKKIEKNKEETLNILKKAPKNFLEETLEALQENPYLKQVKEEKFLGAVSEMAEKVVKAPQLTGEDYPKVIPGTDFAKIAWMTDKKSNSLVAIAEDKNYNPKKQEPYQMIVGEPEDLVTYHQVIIENLEPSTLYHFQVRSKPLVGPLAKSEDKTFTTLSLSLEISDISTKKVSPTEVEVFFKTNLPAKTELNYKNLATNKEEQVSDNSFVRDHKISLANLMANIEYSVLINVEDEKGQKAVSPRINFSTGEDTKPPEILEVKTTSAISPRGQAIQTIITWRTDELSTSRIYYVEGIKWDDKLAKSTRLDNVLTTRHIVVLPKLKPGRVYLFKTESLDSSKNKKISKTYTIFTPQKRKTIIQIMIEQFGKTFGWMRRVGI